jgi:hypothetical protein
LAIEDITNISNLLTSEFGFLQSSVFRDDYFNDPQFHLEADAEPDIKEEIVLGQI